MSSNLAAGARVAAMITGYEVAREDGDWRATGPATTVVDEEAPPARLPRRPRRCRATRARTRACASCASASSCRRGLPCIACGRRPPPRFPAVGAGVRRSRRGGRRLLPVGALGRRRGRGLRTSARHGRSHWFDAARPSVAAGLPGGDERQRRGGTDRRRARRGLGFRSLSAGGTFVCGRCFDDTVHCWGRTPDSVAGMVPAGTWPHVQERERWDRSRLRHPGEGRQGDLLGRQSAYGQAPRGPSSDRFKASATLRGPARRQGRGGGENAHGEAPPGPLADRSRA